MRVGEFWEGGVGSINNGLWLHMHAATLNVLLLLLLRLAWFFFFSPPVRLLQTRLSVYHLTDGGGRGGELRGFGGGGFNGRTARLADDFHTAASRKLPSMGEHGF